MTTNNKPWQTIVNADNFATAGQSINNLSVAKNDGETEETSISYKANTVLPKRYSFDDNGGGYQGL
ncbi:MAG TPA: hypothetical protein VGB71_11070 [Flavisolibacter sp.]|jgi:hypothetical protein